MADEDTRHRIGIGSEAGERAETTGQVCGGGVGLAADERGERCCERSRWQRVIGGARGHQQRTQVREAQAELPEALGSLADELRRVVRVADEHVLRDERDAHRLTQTLDVEFASGSGLLVEERQQVDARQVARGVVEVDVFAAGIAGADRTVGGRSVPAVDGRRELHAGIGALPRRLGNLAQQIPRPDSRGHLARWSALAAPTLRRLPPLP